MFARHLDRCRRPSGDRGLCSELADHVFPLWHRTANRQADSTNSAAAVKVDRRRGDEELPRSACLECSRLPTASSSSLPLGSTTQPHQPQHPTALPVLPFCVRFHTLIRRGRRRGQNQKAFSEACGCGGGGIYGIGRRTARLAPPASGFAEGKSIHVDSVS